MEFRWLTPLGIAVAIFLGWGLLNVFVGVVAPLLYLRDPNLPANYLVISRRTDAAVFGTEPSELVRTQPEIRTLQRLLVFWMAGLWVAFGALTLSITWFALRRGELWALVALAVAGLATLASFGIVLAPYLRQQAPLALQDLPPLFLYPAALLVPGVVLAWIGLNS